MTPRQSDDLVEVYHSDSTTEARRVLDTLLIPAGIEGVLHDRRDHMFPAPATEPGEVAVAVREGDRERAVEILRQAEQDGYLEGGEILPAPPG